MKHFHDDGYYTIKRASVRLNIPYWKLLRAVNEGLVPHHRLLNSTKYLKLFEVEAAMRTMAGHASGTPETHQECSLKSPESAVCHAGTSDTMLINTHINK